MYTADLYPVMLPCGHTISIQTYSSIKNNTCPIDRVQYSTTFRPVKSHLILQLATTFKQNPTPSLLEERKSDPKDSLLAPCKFWQTEGVCKFGEKCYYRHDVSEQGQSGLKKSKNFEEALKIAKPKSDEISPLASLNSKDSQNSQNSNEEKKICWDYPNCKYGVKCNYIHLEGNGEKKKVCYEFSASGTCKVSPPMNCPSRTVSWSPDRPGTR